MEIINIHEAKTHLSQLLEKAAKGKEIIIAKAGKPIAKLVPYTIKKKPRVPGGEWEGKVEIKEDFDDLPESFTSSFYDSKS
jgi:prevent-host-death family protein